MHKFRIEEELERILSKLQKKNKDLYEQVKKKINEVITDNDIEHYKNLRYDLKDFKRVQVGHHILVFKYEKQKDLVSFVYFDHHDNVYKWRPNGE